MQRKIFPFTETAGISLVQILPGAQGERIYSTKGISCTLAAQTGGFGGKTGLYEVGLPIKENTKKGYKMAYPGDSISLAFAGLNTRRGRVGRKSPIPSPQTATKEPWKPVRSLPRKGKLSVRTGGESNLRKNPCSPSPPKTATVFFRRPNPQADSKRMPAAARLAGRTDRQSASYSIGRTALQTGRKRRYRYSGGSHRQTVGFCPSGGECHRLI